MAYQLRITVEQLDDTGVMSVSQKVFPSYTDVTDANLHNLAVERTLLDLHAKLAAMKAEDPGREGRFMTDQEREEIGAA